MRARPDARTRDVEELGRLAQLGAGPRERELRLQQGPLAQSPSGVNAEPAGLAWMWNFYKTADVAALQVRPRPRCRFP
jgi:hypothetical protein